MTRESVQSAGRMTECLALIFILANLAVLGYFAKGYTNDPPKCLAAEGYNLRLELAQPAIYETNKSGSSTTTTTSTSSSSASSSSSRADGHRMLDNANSQTSSKTINTPNGVETVQTTVTKNSASSTTPESIKTTTVTTEPSLDGGVITTKKTVTTTTSSS